MVSLVVSGCMVVVVIFLDFHCFVLAVPCRRPYGIGMCIARFQSYILGDLNPRLSRLRDFAIFAVIVGMLAKTLQHHSFLIL